ncbi:MAG: hypothetical protein KF900_05915 [Bacteroidetes bacterium]|nr:hypothetical protein [Bacteroidota bacterium]
MKTKKILLTIVLFTLVAFAKAQDKYEFMTVHYEFNSLSKGELQISIDGDEFLKEDVELKKKEKEHFNANPLLAKVKEYQSKGWEVMNFHSYGFGNGFGSNSNVLVHTAYLRKKK